MKSVHCCEKIHALLAEEKVAIGYSPKFRSYYIDLRGSEYGAQDIYYCPWCGSQFPKALDEEYDGALASSLGINVEEITLDTYCDPNIPEEFKTDEWWKKRGL